MNLNGAISKIFYSLTAANSNNESTGSQCGSWSKPMTQEIVPCKAKGKKKEILKKLKCLLFFKHFTLNKVLNWCLSCVVVIKKEHSKHFSWQSKALISNPILFVNLQPDFSATGPGTKIAFLDLLQDKITIGTKDCLLIPSIQHVAR